MNHFLSVLRYVCKDVMASNSSFYLEVDYQSQFSFCILITEQGDWRFINASDMSVYGKDPNWQRGKWKDRWGSPTEGMKDFMTQDGQTHAFSLSHIRFLPAVKSDKSFYQNQFHLGDLWAKQLGVDDNDRRGSWAPIATGPFITEVKQHMEEMQKEFRQVCIMIGLDVVALVDPTGLMNFPAAIQASRMGDYLGCTLNLLGLIPVIGKAATAAKNAKAIQRISFLTTELEFLNRWLKLSVKALRRGNAAESTLNLSIQGTTRATKVVRAGEEIAAARKLKNVGWVQRLGADLAESVGMLPEELKAFQRLAEAGYFFVARSCNPARVKWLRWAQRTGTRILSKPMWIKWKTLKQSESCNGLVGILKIDSTYANTMKELKEVSAAHLPPGFKLSWLENIAGAYPKPPKVFKAINPHNVTEIEDAERMANHFLVDMGDSFILVDSKGSAYIGDIDIASIQRRLSNGSFGPPGYKVGTPDLAASVYRGGSDSVELESYFNQFFKGVGYPPGYDVFQHGGRTGSAGFFKGKQAPFDFFGNKTLVGWSPKGDWNTEQLIVAVKGAENLEGCVGYTKSWKALKRFHEANPMGEFRFRKYTKLDEVTGLPDL